MDTVERRTISLKGTAETVDEEQIELGVFDLLLPCRNFEVDHKVAVLGRVSLTTEFMLRLVKSADGISEQDAASFFGFDRRDMAFILTEVENLGYIERRDGRLRLTLEGDSLFREGSVQPEIFEVEKRRETVGFDLIALAPQPPGFLDSFELRLPELTVLDGTLASTATQFVPDAFRRYYLEITRGRERTDATKRSLYSIDDIAPGGRFSSLVRFVLRSAVPTPASAEADLSDWRPDHEQHDRAPIAHAVSAFVAKMSIPRGTSDSAAYDTLITMAPDFLKEFTRRDGLAVDRYFKEALSRVGEVRADRPTIPIIGSLFTRDNVKRLVEVLGYGQRAQNGAEAIIWVAPNAPCWGATRTLPDLLRQLVLQIQTGQDESVKSVCLSNNRVEWHLEAAFDDIAVAEKYAFPNSLEILLIPGLLAALLVHAPIGAPSGHAVPIGFLSFDKDVVARTEDLLLDKSPAFGSKASFIEGIIENSRDAASSNPV